MPCVTESASPSFCSTNKIVININAILYNCLYFIPECHQQPTQSLRVAQYGVNIRAYCSVTESLWNKRVFFLKVSEERTDMHPPNIFGNQITHCCLSRIPLFSLSDRLLLHFGSLHLGFQDFLEKKNTAVWLLNDVIVKGQDFK